MTTPTINFIPTDTERRDELSLDLDTLQRLNAMGPRDLAQMLHAVAMGNPNLSDKERGTCSDAARALRTNLECVEEEG